MSRFGVVALLLCAAQGIAAAEGDGEAADQTGADAPAAASPEDEPRRLQLGVSLFGELVGRSVGAEVSAAYSLRRTLDLGLGLDVGSSPGILLMARLRPQVGAAWPFRPFAQLRLSLHPASSGYGGGLFAGVLIDAGPGRVQLGAAGQLYLPSSGHLPFAVMGLAGYELDVWSSPPPSPRVDVPEAHPEALPEAEVPAVTVKRLDPAPPDTSIRGKLKDSDGRPVTATVRLAGGGSAPVTGREFFFPVAPGSHLLIVEADGFLTRGAPAQVAQGERLAIDLVLRPEPDRATAVLTKKGVKISQQIQFEPTASRILPESFFILDEVIDILLRTPRLRQVRIECHTDNVGGAAFNQNLSEERAMAVMQYLIEKGVDPSRLRGEGLGQGRPLADNRSEAGRAKNRRVQFEIVEVGD
ncbi:MAG: OmpA family protein [Myxococcaceae bacterium]